jgi:hypothetical protein
MLEPQLQIAEFHQIRFVSAPLVGAMKENNKGVDSETIFPVISLVSQPTDNQSPVPASAGRSAGPDYRMVF